MASRHELEVTISSAKDLKNVNWRYGPNKPYAVGWVYPNLKVSTQVDKEGDTCPHWDKTLLVTLPGRFVDESDTLCIDIVHAGDEEDTKKLIGSARLKLIEVLDEAGLGEPLKRSLTLKRPSGRPQGKLEVKVTIREPPYHPPGGYYAPPYSVRPAARDYPPPLNPYCASPPPPPPPGGYSYNTYNAPPPSGYPTAPPPSGYPTAPPPSGYPYNTYNAPPPPSQPAASSYSYYGSEQKKSGKFGGMGTGLAVGAVAGALGGIALVEGAEALEDHFADRVAERVEDDLGYDGYD